MPVTDRERKNFGKAAEDAAADYLAHLGFRILDRNWRSGRQELDIVAMDGDMLVFVEVRARQSGGMLMPAESVTAAKRRHLQRGAQLYLAAHQAWDMPCRFDFIGVVTVTGPGGRKKLELEHFVDVM